MAGIVRNMTGSTESGEGELPSRYHRCQSVFEGHCGQLRAHVDQRADRRIQYLGYRIRRGIVSTDVRVYIAAGSAQRFSQSDRKIPKAAQTNVPTETNNSRFAGPTLLCDFGQSCPGCFSRVLEYPTCDTLLGSAQIRGLLLYTS